MTVKLNFTSVVDSLDNSNKPVLLIMFRYFEPLVSYVNSFIDVNIGLKVEKLKIISIVFLL
jgi:hypothetical protein